MRSRQQELEVALTRAQQEAAALATQLSEAKRESADVAALLAGAEGRAQAAEQVGSWVSGCQPACSAAGGLPVSPDRALQPLVSHRSRPPAVVCRPPPAGGERAALRAAQPAGRAERGAGGGAGPGGRARSVQAAGRVSPYLVARLHSCTSALPGTLDATQLSTCASHGSEPPRASTVLHPLFLSAGSWRQRSARRPTPGSAWPTARAAARSWRRRCVRRPPLRRWAGQGSRGWGWGGAAVR